MTATSYRDPQCWIWPVFDSHVCSRRDGRALHEPGEECFFGTQRPSLLDQADAARVVDTVADRLARHTESTLAAFFWAEVADAQRLERMVAEAEFRDWLAGGVAS